MSSHLSSSVSVPEVWLNLAVQIPFRLPLPINASGNTATEESLRELYTNECVRIELLKGSYADAPLVDVPGEVLDQYRKYRPTPLCRARGLERRLAFDGQIYFKREDLNPTGSHKPNTAIPQAYYASRQGLSELVTDTGAGQWGAALAWACKSFGLQCTVFMTRNSFLSKPYRRYMMELSGAQVVASPSSLTSEGRKLLETIPNHAGSLGIGMGEAMEYLLSRSDARLALGCMSYYAALHQTVIGQELSQQLQEAEVDPDMLIACVGGGTNFVGFVAPFVPSARTTATRRPRLIAAESANVPVLTKGVYEYEHADAFALTPQVKMYTLGRQFLPPEIHAGGLRYHGKSPILSLLHYHGVTEATGIHQDDAFHAGKLFFESEGIIPAPESSHAIAHVITEVESAKQRGEKPVIVFCLSGTGYLDLQAFTDFFGTTAQHAE